MSAAQTLDDCKNYSRIFPPPEVFLCPYVLNTIFTADEDVLTFSVLPAGDVSKCIWFNEVDNFTSWKTFMGVEATRVLFIPLTQFLAMSKLRYYCLQITTITLQKSSEPRKVEHRFFYCPVAIPCLCLNPNTSAFAMMPLGVHQLPVWYVKKTSYL